MFGIQSLVPPAQHRLGAYFVVLLLWMFIGRFYISGGLFLYLIVFGVTYIVVCLVSLVFHLSSMGMRGVVIHRLGLGSVPANHEAGLVDFGRNRCGMVVYASVSVLFVSMFLCSVLLEWFLFVSAGLLVLVADAVASFLMYGMGFGYGLGTIRYSPEGLVGASDLLRREYTVSWSRADLEVRYCGVGVYLIRFQIEGIRIYRYVDVDTVNAVIAQNTHALQVTDDNCSVADAD
ncbi:MAG TPA: hypothetical protein EYO33_27075 [Phycisphaerales bacterium]|nr:hypothetical protein [Phycisphaerales bacterium]